MDDLRTQIRSRYGSEAKFAYALGWSRQYLNRILNRQRVPDINDVSSIAKELGEPIGRIANIFLQ
jgi:transcriptional regulator with XRE-family HTH domain